ncbi:UNKNOWN [Stylonychia lemnae]|uniref:Uncharacterized protein n=1 Tax=Stylonychia lemnae TaxID=5949 RepID=A0A078AVC2_STYLE|nr:UNKNOWN [Stylonychia lemnae]|eukprot:CDW84783.1 UNKNOWN [Stylonychia lemnae]
MQLYRIRQRESNSNGFPFQCSNDSTQNQLKQIVRIKVFKNNDYSQKSNQYPEKSYRKNKIQQQTSFRIKMLMQKMKFEEKQEIQIDIVVNLNFESLLKGIRTLWELTNFKAISQVAACLVTLKINESLPTQFTPYQELYSKTALVSLEYRGYPREHLAQEIWQELLDAKLVYCDKKRAFLRGLRNMCQVNFSVMKLDFNSIQAVL